MVSMFPLQFGIPGGPELLVILLIAVLLFGANKIPKLARSTGEAMGEFQKGREEVEQELQAMREGPTDDASLETEEGPAVEAATTEGGTAADETTADETEADEEEDVDAPVGDVGIEDAETDEETN